MSPQQLHAAGTRLEQAREHARKLRDLLCAPVPLRAADELLDAGEGVMSHIETAQETIERALALVEAEIERVEHIPA